ncbi:MAG: Hpt domain-containing protein [Defluviitaleaceae bacterium]|nr:Hpt domain-containing protein [Defluviitaleaceae bacterium]
MGIREKVFTAEELTDNPRILQDPSAYAGKMASLFDNGRPIHIETGCADGMFITQTAALYQSVNHIAVGQDPSVLAAAARKSQGDEGSLVFLLLDLDDMPNMFPSGEIDRLYINFRDPWRNELAIYEALEIPEIFFKTDDPTVFELSISQLSERCWKLRNISLDWRKSGTEDSNEPIYRLEAYKEFKAESVLEYMYDETLNANVIPQETADALRLEFAQEQKSLLPKLESALESNDFVTAHRLVHNLKGLAGLVGEITLARSAGDLERFLKNADVSDQLSDVLLKSFYRRLAIFRNDFKCVVDITHIPKKAVYTPSQRIIDRDQVKGLLDRLHNLLAAGNGDSLDMVDDIYRLPEAQTLADLVEECDFPAALTELDKVRKIWGV